MATTPRESQGDNAAVDLLLKLFEKVSEAKLGKEQFLEKTADMFVQLVRIFGFEGTFDPAPTVSHWKRTMEVNKMKSMKFVKLKLSNFFAHHRGQPVIPIRGDSPGVLLGGKVHRYMELLKKKDFDRFDQLNFSILQSKKGCPRPNEETCIAGAISTFVDLTQKVPLVTDVDDILKREIARTVLEVFGTKYVTPHDFAQGVTIPSFSSTYNNSRTDYGAYGDIFAQDVGNGGSVDLDYIPETENPQDIFTNRGHLAHTLQLLRSQFDGIKRKPSVPSRKKLSPKEMKSWKESLAKYDAYVHEFTQLHKIALAEMDNSKYTKFDWGSMDDEFRSNEPIVTFDLKKSKRILKIVYRLTQLNLENRLESDDESLSYVKLTPLAEPLKVRVISGHDGPLQWFLSPLQKMLYQKMTALKQFLVGRDITEEEFAGWKLPESKEFISVDYEGATNNLRKDLSEYAIQCLMDNWHLPKEVQSLVRLNLLNTIIEYDVVSRDMKFKTKLAGYQSNGQLMGSVISFPFLCVINAAVCRKAIELDTSRTMPLAECDLRINGDDAVFMSGEEGYRVWADLSAAAGLKPSVGKVYKSPEFFNMNSRDIRYSPSKHGFTMTKFVNMGLYLGLKRSGETRLSVENSDCYNLGTNLLDLEKDTPSTLYPHIHRSFVQLHMEKLKKSGVPWYVPRVFGGLGLPPLLEYKNATGDVDDTRVIELEGPSDLDKKIVRAMVNGILPKAPQPFSPSTTDGVMIHKIAMHRFGKLLKYEYTLVKDDKKAEHARNLVSSMYTDSVVHYPLLCLNVCPGELDLRMNQSVWHHYNKHLSQFAHLKPFERILAYRRYLIGPNVLN
jgi:hypothetical protein